MNDKAKIFAIIHLYIDFSNINMEEVRLKLDNYIYFDTLDNVNNIWFQSTKASL